MVRSPDLVKISCLPTSPALPAYPSAWGPVEEGKLLGCQQDPVGAPHQLQLLDAQSGDERKRSAGVLPRSPLPQSGPWIHLYLRVLPCSVFVSISGSSQSHLRALSTVLMDPFGLGLRPGTAEGLMWLLGVSFSVPKMPGGPMG